jgi:hypothetical protein
VEKENLVLENTVVRVEEVSRIQLVVNTLHIFFPPINGQIEILQDLMIPLTLFPNGCGLSQKQDALGLVEVGRDVTLPAQALFQPPFSHTGLLG